MISLAKHTEEAVDTNAFMKKVKQNEQENIIRLKDQLLEYHNIKPEENTKQAVKTKLNPNQYGGIMAPYSFSSVSPERHELRPSNFLTFLFLPLGCQKNINMLFLDLLPWKLFCREYFD